MLGLDGVRGLTIAFSDNNGITRSRTVPFGKLDEAVERGVGITSLFPVFTSTDGITFAHEPLSTPSGDLRLCATADRVRQLAGQPAFAWTPGPAVRAGRHALGVLPARRARATGRAGRRGRARGAGRVRARVVHRPRRCRALAGAPRAGLRTARDARGERVLHAAPGRPRCQRHRGRPAACGVRARPDGARDQSRRSRGGGRHAAADATDDPRGGARDTACGPRSHRS